MKIVYLAHKNGINDREYMQTINTCAFRIRMHYRICLKVTYRYSTVTSGMFGNKMLSQCTGLGYCRLIPQHYWLAKQNRKWRSLTIVSCCRSACCIPFTRIRNVRSPSFCIQSPAGQGLRISVCFRGVAGVCREGLQDTAPVCLSVCFELFYRSIRSV